MAGAWGLEQDEGSWDQNEGSWEENGGSWEQVHLCGLKIHPQCLQCVLGIPAGLSLPTLYLRHLSGISHQSAEAPGREGLGQALLPPDWSDRSQGASGVPRAPWEPQSGHMHGREQSHHPRAGDVRAEDVAEGA